VEPVAEGDDFEFGARGIGYLAGFAGEFDGGFVGFRSGVADEDGGEGGHAGGFVGFLDEELGEGAGPGVVVEVGGVDEDLGLFEKKKKVSYCLDCWVDLVFLAFTCLAIMLLNSGSQCPREFTAIPAVKSRYFLSSRSQR